MLDTMLFPPSPALSECDSLDGIDDLDAFLASKGKLSHFPTPPPQKKDTIIINTAELSDSSSEHSFDSNMEVYTYHYYAAMNYRQEATMGRLFSRTDDLKLSKLWESLDEVQLPLEILELTMSILLRLRHRDENGLLSPDHYRIDWYLIVTAALMLASDYLDDIPRKITWWRDWLCHEGADLLPLIEAKTMLLKSIDWALHSCASPHAMAAARRRLPGGRSSESSEGEPDSNSDMSANSHDHEGTSAHRRTDSAVGNLTSQFEEIKIE
ncbi:hypothetical protein HII31_11024 [Pseudocercospora fuligena]|uniref:Uncharacterized protein n=1 Tax=Pseudocercospora fuligena TaxID=685502 RepID=A0A8H6VI69_9PEZI|nr:hypothetical protein HII31_11024 [Pseudocercospora fuligena]